MSLALTAATAAVDGLADFDAVIDVRSPAEFAEDHLPGALNWPVLDDTERARVGTLYVQVSPHEARKVGAALVARRIATLVEQHVHDKPREWRPLVYCWRGGQRSGSLSLVLSQIGFRVAQLEGGYRAFRALVREQLDALAATLEPTVLCGRTGSGKTRLLQALAARGEQVLDLEALACHRGSVLGPLPGVPQPSQKAFETALWHALRNVDRDRPLYAEGESRTIGRLRLPQVLVERMRQAAVLRVEMPLEARVAFLLDDYAHFVNDTEAFCERLQALRELRGAVVVSRWQQLARAGDTATVVRELLAEHYDPIYQRSMERHFLQFGQATEVALAHGSAAAFAAAAEAIVSRRC